MDVDQKQRKAVRMKAETKIALVALIVSIISLILSQFQPLYTYLQKPEIQLIPSKQIRLNHQWGNISIGHWLQARNMGDGTGTINRIEYFIKSEDSKYKKKLETKYIAIKPSADSMVAASPMLPLGTVTLKPSEVWEELVVSLGPSSLADQSKMMDIMQRISKDHQSAPTGAPEQKPKRAGQTQVDDAAIQEARKFMQGNLEPLVAGKYNLLMMVWLNENPTPSFRVMYEFTIYEYNVVALKNSVEDMIEWAKQGPSYMPTSPLPLDVELSEIKDDGAVSKMYEAYRAQ